MAVREFDSSQTDDIVLDVGGLSAMVYGTIALLFKGFDDTRRRKCFGLFQPGTGDILGLTTRPSGEIRWQSGVGTAAGVGSLWTTNTWHLLVVRKGTGVVSPRFSIYDYTADTWTHGTSGDTAEDSDPVGGTGTIRFTDDSGSNFHFDGRLAVVAAWSNAVHWSADASGDSAIEAAGLETSAANWLDESPDGMWRFNQASTSTDVTDDTGNGADQTSISGTSVVTGDDPPGFDFSITSGVPYGRTTEIETVRGFTPAKAAALGRVTETDTTRIFAAGKSAVYGRVTEAETIRAFVAAKTATYGRVTETEITRAFTTPLALVAIITGGATGAGKPVNHVFSGVGGRISVSGPRRSRIVIGPEVGPGV